MKLVVCVKQIINPETPAAAFRIDPQRRRAVPAKNYPLVISDYDQVAVEAAVRIKEAKGGEVTVLSLGDPAAVPAIKHCLAMGADRGILLSDPVFGEEDRSQTAYVLAKAIGKIGDFDLILCGRQEGDWDGGQVGPGIAEILGIPSVGPVKRAEAGDRVLLAERILSDGYEVIEIPLPALVAVSSELGVARYPNMKGIMGAARKKVDIWSAGEIGAEPEKCDPFQAKMEMIELFIPAHEGKCEFVAGESPEEAGVNLYSALRQAMLI